VLLIYATTPDTFFFKCAFFIFWSTRNGSKNKFGDMQSKIKMVLKSNVYSTHIQWHTACGRFIQIAVNHHCHHNFMALTKIPSQWLIDSHQHTCATKIPKIYANRWCRIRTDCIIAGIRIRYLASGTFGHLKENVLVTQGHFFNKNGTVLERTRRMGTLVLKEKVFNYFIIHMYNSLVK
jgi:hypothetical protein